MVKAESVRKQLEIRVELSAPNHRRDSRSRAYPASILERVKKCSEVHARRRDNFRSLL